MDYRGVCASLFWYIVVFRHLHGYSIGILSLVESKRQRTCWAHHGVGSVYVSVYMSASSASLGARWSSTSSSDPSASMDAGYSSSSSSSSSSSLLLAR